MDRSLKTITTSRDRKPIYIDESQNIAVDDEFVLGGLSLDRPINGRELEDALDTFALMHPSVNEDGELQYYCGKGIWNKVQK